MSILDVDDALDGTNELTDEELRIAEQGNLWFPEPDEVEDEVILEEVRRNAPKVSSAIRPSLFTERAFWMPTATDSGLVSSRFTFEGRRHLRRIYDSPSRRILLFCGRQVEKSTMLGNIALCYMCLIQSYRVLYVSPSATQTKVFSMDRVKEPLETSPVLKRFTTKMLSQNILEKQFVNRSKITLRYAFLNADRTRGIPAMMLELDEFQDILSDNIPVIEQCLSHTPEHLKRFFYAGTPKSLDNNLEYYRSRLSTQGEWVVPCEGCNHWNILGEKNIGKKGLICEKCSKLINPMHERAQWAWGVADAPYESYRISQLMVPWRSWDEILLDYRKYSRDRFYNEVLGISFDSGLRPLTQADIKANCRSYIRMDQIQKYAARSFSYPVFMGVDWGSGENSYTVVTLGTYVEAKFRVFYMHRFTGQETDPVYQLDIIRNLVRDYNVRLIGTDYGGGYDRNDTLIRAFGPQRVFKYQYAARPNAKVKWDSRLRRFITHRTEVMSDIFNAIKRRTVFEFPEWDGFVEPHGQDMLNIFSEYNNTLHMIQYKHSPDKPDDSFHSLLYCFLVSMLVTPRPDVVAPRKGDKFDPSTGVWRPADQG